MIEVRIDQLLSRRGHTFYWLAKETGISHTTLWRLKKAKAYGIALNTLEKICDALNCQPGDILVRVEGDHPPFESKRKAGASKKQAPKGKQKGG